MNKDTRPALPFKVLHTEGNGPVAPARDLAEKKKTPKSERKVK
jgi:hypothetical protein